MSNLTANTSLLLRSLSNVGFKVLFVFSPRRRLEGIRVVLLQKGRGTEDSFSRIAAALALIRRSDPRSYRNVSGHLARIVVTDTAGSLGWYWHNLRACFLDPGHVAEASPAVLAMTIVHEAAHARLRQLGLKRGVECRSRVEAACIRAEIQFASRLPDSRELVDDAARRRQIELSRVE